MYDLLVDAGAGRGTDKVLDTILLTFLVLLAREPAALVELAETYPASYAYSAIPTRPNTPISISRSVSKEKRKSPSTAPDTASRSLVDILFTLLRIHTPNNDDDNPEDGPPSSDPLVLSSSDAYTDAHFKRVGIGKKEKGMVDTNPISRPKPSINSFLPDHHPTYDTKFVVDTRIQIHDKET